MAGTLGSLVVSLEANIARFTSDMGRAAQQTEQTMQRIDASTLQTQRAMQRLDSSAAMVKASLMGIAGGATIGSLINVADAAAMVTGKIRMVTDSFSELKSVQAELLATAQRTRQSFESTADLYSKVTRAADGLNLTQKDLVKFTGAVNNAMVVSAAGAQQSSAAILQLGQAVASGKLGGDEFKSIAENAPRLIQAIADGMGVARGQMKQYATDGKLTSEVITQAIIGQFGKLETEAAKMPVTIGQSFQQLRNVIVDYMTSTSETSKIADAVATAVAGITNNLSKLEAVVAGLVSYKLAAWTLEIAAAMVVKANAAYTTAGALSTERFATIAAAQANVVAAEAEAASTATKAALIAELRAEALATLARTNAVINSTASDAASTLAMQSRAVAMTELAALSRAHVTNQANITAANAAAAAAQARLNAANTAGAGAAGLAARSLGLLGGPIGVVTTVLGLGVAAWMLWGNSAKEVEKKATDEVEKSTVEIISDLDKQIKKLQERNALSASGLKGIATTSTPEADRMASLRAQMEDASNGKGDYAGLDKTAQSDILLKLGVQYGELYSKIQTVAVEKDKLEGKTKSEKLEAWLEKNEQYLSKAQQLAVKLKKAKAELGDAYTPKIEAAITADFNKGDKKEADTESAKLAKKTLDGQLKDLEEGLAQQQDELSFGNRYMAELRQQDLIDQATYNDYRRLAFESSVSVSAQAYDKEISLAEAYRDRLKKGSEREEAQTKIDTLKAKRAKAVQDAQQAGAMETLALSAAQSDLNRVMKEWGAQQDQSISQMQFINDMYGKTTLEVAKLTEARRIELDIEEKIRLAKEKGAITDASIAKFRADGKVKADGAGKVITQAAGLQVLKDQRSPEDIERENHANIIAVLEASKAQELASTAKWNTAIELETARHEGAKRSMRMQSDMQVVQMAGDSASQLYSIMQQAGLEQTALGRALFVASKALAVAEIIMNTEVAAAKALTMGPLIGPPLATAIRVMGYASAGIVIGTTLASAEGGFDIPAGTNPVTQLHEKEMVLPKAQADVIRGLAANGGKGAGGISVTYAPNIQIDGSTDMARNKQMIDGAVKQGNADLVDRLQRAGRL